MIVLSAKNENDHKEFNISTANTGFIYMVISGIEDIFNSKDAIVLATMSYQTYPFFSSGKVLLLFILIFINI